MSVVASVHLADIGLGRALRVLRRVPRPGSIEGLLQANVGAAAPFSPSLPPRPRFRRVVLAAFWESDDALTAFLDRHPLAGALAHGWHARLEPLRAFGAWPGLPDDTPRPRTTEYEGPSVVLTLGRLRLGQTLRFLRASRRAERAVLSAPGLVWATGFARPPFVATCSLWSSADSLRAYAYGDPQGGHPAAIEADRTKPFHHHSAFVRFRPYDVVGALEGSNPLPARALRTP